MEDGARTGDGLEEKVPGRPRESEWQRWPGGGWGRECRLFYGGRMSFGVGSIGMLKLTRYTETRRMRP
jgi:hypothetical protein